MQSWMSYTIYGKDITQVVNALPTCNWLDGYASPIPWLKKKFPVAGTCKDDEPLWISES